MTEAAAARWGRGPFRGGAGLALLLLAAGPARAQERPKEADIFGQPPAGEPASDKRAEEAERPPPAEDASRDEAILGASDPGQLAREAAPDDPLRIGGMFYLRALTTALDEETPKSWSFAAPALMDAYLDARPNQRVRGLILGRLLFDPTLPEQPPPPMPMSLDELAPGDTGGADAILGSTDLGTLFVPARRGPVVALDQMWLRFDIEHRLFVTAGKQHVRWGTGRFWTPTDFLHVRRRNPLAVFDARTGTTMVKLHAPWEERGWNLYAYGVLEGEGATPQLGDIAGAARAEVVLGTSEIGAGALVRRGHKPRIGLDASMGVWDLDLYGEMALRWGEEIDRVTRSSDFPALPNPLPTNLPGLVDALYPLEQRSGVKAQVVGGASYSRKYNDNDVFHLGLEYFYNPLGYESSDVYPGLLFPHSVPLRDPATFFYLGRHYGGVFLSVPAPYAWDQTTFTLSTLGNLSDRTFITRFDYALVMLTHLRFEAFVAWHYGTEGGEFRFALTSLERARLLPSVPPPPRLDLGLGLRVNL